MKMAVPRSPKFRRLERLTGCKKVELIGTLELLWLFTMEHAPAGDVGKWPDADIEFECGWDGEPGALIAALIDAGWLDRCLDHGLIVHDWSDHLPEFLRLRVHRGSLVIAILNPPPPENAVPEGENVRRAYDSRTTDVGREESLGKGSQESLGEREQVASLPPLSLISEGKGNKPESFGPEQMADIHAWAGKKKFKNATLNEALEIFRDWEPLKSQRRTQKQWVSAFKKICRDSVSEGKIGRAEGNDLKPKGPAYVEFRGYDEQGNRR